MAHSDATPGNDLLEGATPIQRRWVIARLMAKSDAEAARVVDIDKGAVSRWHNKAQLDAAVAAMLAAPMEHARAILEEAIPEAARVKIAGLKSRNEFVKQAASTNILDRGMGKATQKTEVSGPGGTTLVIGIGGIDPDVDI